MLKFVGSLIIMATGLWFSFKFSKEQKDKINVTASLINFVSHVKGSIYTARLPLEEIYSSYTDPILDTCGFMLQLKTLGLESALKTVEERITKRSCDSLINLSSKLGGINTETQIKLCEETINILKDEQAKQNEFYVEKKKMYQAMPILLAMSIIIMTM